MEMNVAVLIVVAGLGAVGGGLAVALVLGRRPGGSPSAGVVDTVVAVADERLGATTGLLDAQLRAMGDQLSRVGDAVSRQQGELSAQRAATMELSSTAAALREVLASPQSRGQWGERMADDVLRAAGMVEGVSYVRQRAIGAGTVPDVTFLLPGDLVLHLDAKFPIDAYVRCLDAGTDHERDHHRDAFLRDVRARVRELRGRGYVDPAAGTLDFVLCFIPNESVYAFIHTHDTGLVDEALAQRVVLCSPLTLFTVLGVIRQSVEAVNLARTSDEILALLGAFGGQWERFCASLDKVGRAVDTLERAYGEVSGTRRRALERPLDRIDELRRQRGIEPAEAAHGDDLRLVRGAEG
ncbi:MAG TPA: DNA recombination protein RmuC [Acidimicrobiales bacterium]|nr:DNA recombination protein RmuC [Acidimicrobiales bacterium]